MTTSAAAASRAMIAAGARACTDITGFGLLGHAFEMAKASNVTLEIDATAVPLLPDVLELIAQGMLTRGDKNNRVYVGDAVTIADSVTSELKSALFDPQTAGGLLISLPSANVDKFIAEFPDAVVIGRVATRGEYLIEVS